MQDSRRYALLRRQSRSFKAITALLMLVLIFPAPLSADTFTLNFKDADVGELIKFVSEATGETFLVHPGVKAKINVVSSTPLDEGGLYELFLAVLEIHGYTSVRGSDGIVSILPIKQAKTEPGPVGAGTTPRDSREVVIRVVGLTNISANKLIGVLRPLLSPDSHLVAYPPTNSMIVADTSANIAKMLKIISRIDKQTEGRVTIASLKYADAGEVSKLVERLGKKDAEDKGAPLLLVPDNRTNSILIKGNEISTDQAMALISRLDTPAGQLSNARVIYLKHADAMEVAPILNKVIENIVSNRNTLNKTQKKARLEAHEGTNSLIITADGEVLKTLEAIITRLDVRRSQVLVEAIIVEVRDNDTERIGTEFLFADSSHGAFSFSEGASGVLSPLIARLDDASGSELLRNLSGGLSAREGGVLGLGDFTDPDQLFGLLVSALKSNTHANVLSTPSLLTLENTEAYIVVGQNVPFITGSYTNTNNNNPFQTISRRDIGTTLKVTPYINEGDTVLLDIEQEVSSLSGAATGNAADIITNQRKIQTSILAANKQIVVLGGLIANTQEQIKRKVPVLGSIPILGFLFRSNSIEQRRTNLLVFIRPTIIRNNKELDQETQTRYNYIRRTSQDNLRRFNDSKNSEFFQFLPSWQDQIENQIDAAGLRSNKDRSETTN